MSRLSFRRVATMSRSNLKIASPSLKEEQLMMQQASWGAAFRTLCKWIHPD